MFDKRLLWTSAAVIVVMMTAVVAVSLPLSQREESVPSREDVSNVEMETDANVEEETPPVYMLKEYTGRIGVYIGGGEEPEMVLDVPVRHLPEYDQELLMRGIPAETYDQLVALIEDYIS